MSEANKSGRRSIAAKWCRRACGALATAIVSAISVAVVGAWIWPDLGTPENAGSVSYATAAMFNVRVFQMHLGLAALVATLVIAACRWWRTAGAAAIVVFAILAPYAGEYVPKRPPAAQGQTLRVMSMNLFARNHDAARILDEISRVDPDVIVACEVTPWSDQAVFAPLADRYPYTRRPDYDRASRVLSKMPFRQDSSPAGGGRRPLMFTIDGRDLALYPVHLTSPVSRRYLQANRRQAAALVSRLAAETRPTIVAGDFNFSQLTPQYRSLRARGLRSTHDLAGVGIGTTWGPKWYPWLNRLPGVRIDHILLSPELTASRHEVGGYTGSDHRPIVAEIGFAAKP